MSKRAGADEPPKRAKRSRVGSTGVVQAVAVAGDLTQGPAEIAAEPGAGLESSVADYLRAHPDFFEHHREILALMQIRHESGGAVSLIEHQVTALRRQLEAERGRLAHLISRAREYETLAARHHDLVLHLIPAADLDALHAVLHDGLGRELGAEAVALKLFPVDSGTSASVREDPLVAAFRDFLDRPHALCGPLDPEQGRILFGDSGATLHSAVLVPIRAGARSGVLAIGATDPGRFGLDMRTDLLDRLGEIVSAKLRALPGALPDPSPKTKAVPKRAPRAKTPAPAAISTIGQAPAKTPGQTKPRSKRAPAGDGASTPKPAARAGRATKPSPQSPADAAPDTDVHAD
jgi:uncharacterized protein